MNGPDIYTPSGHMLPDGGGGELLLSSPVGSSSTDPNPSPRPPTKKRKGCGVVGKSIEEELCRICGDRASGYHYNALSCEGCKGFFRRSITKKLTYHCKDGGQCEMDMWMRRKCQACRLRRCQEEGMKVECLLSTAQCKAREIRRKPMKDRKKPAIKHTLDPMGTVVKITSPLTNCHVDNSTSMYNPRPLDLLSQDVCLLIQKLVAVQGRFEMPNKDDVKRVAALSKLYDLNNPDEARELLFTQLTEFTILATRLIVEYAKYVPGFRDLPLQDEITLLKGTTLENLMLRTCRQYDMNTGTVIMADGKAYTKNSLRFAGLGEIVDPMYSFCDSCGKMKMDNAEYSMLIAISLFSDRPNLGCKADVEKIQMIYVRALQQYCEAKVNHRPSATRRFAKLLAKFIDLRTLSRIHSDMCVNLKLKMDNLPPLLLEYFSIQ